MSNESHIQLIGTVIDHAHDVFRVQIDQEQGGQIVTAKLSGKMRMNKINLQYNDRVKVEVSVYDLTIGRIVSRITNNKKTQPQS